MLDKLALLAPSDTPHPGVPALILLDGRDYGAELFSPVAREVVSGEGVECVPSPMGPAFRLRHPETLEAVHRLDAHVLFFVETDTDVKTHVPIARQCRRATFIVHPGQDDSAARALESERLDFVGNVPGGHVPKADAALLSSDWSVPRREFIRRCRRANVPTVSLQEAVNVDFDGPPHRMRWADTVCVSGPQTLRYLRRDIAFLTGNPRFDGYRPAPPPSKPLVLINCNFILGIGGERGPGWMGQVLNVVRELGFEFRVTKHPRDDTDLSGIENVLPSGAYKIAEQLAACSVLVSRDSSVPYEAILSGRPVIYFDPYHEKERTLREDTSGLIHKYDTAEGLRNALSEIVGGHSPAPGSVPGYDPYTFLFTEPGAGSARRVLLALHTIAANPELRRGTDAREDSGFAAALHESIELRVRPALREIGPLRRVWRAVRWRRR